MTLSGVPFTLDVSNNNAFANHQPSSLHYRQIPPKPGQVCSGGVIYLSFRHSPGSKSRRHAVNSCTTGSGCKSLGVMDATTGDFIVQHDAHEKLPPASLTKMMTSYVVSSEVEKGRLGEDDKARVSEYAWRTGGWASGSSVMSLSPNTDVKIIDLMRGMIIQSGNDASIVLAEHIAGSELAFADIMNQHASALDMKDSHFVNSTGLPAEGQRVSAYDMALLGRALIRDFPGHYDIYSERYFEYGGVRQSNRNSLLWLEDSYDGIKTGHTKAAGYNLVASAKRDGMRLISVVLGADSEIERTQFSKSLISYGFRYFETARLFSAGDVLRKDNRIWFGKDDSIGLIASKDVYGTIPKGSSDILTQTIDIDPVIEAPVRKGEKLGKATLRYKDKVFATVKVSAAQNVVESGIFNYLFDWLALFFMELIDSFKSSEN